jgi:predicted nucleic acid-binding protein
MSQLGLLRLLNSPTVMLGSPHDVRTAWRDYDMLMADDRFTFRDEPERLETQLRRIMPQKLVSPKLWQDAYLAAFAITAGLRFVTFDRAFRQFSDLDVVLLGNERDTSQRP